MQIDFNNESNICNLNNNNFNPNEKINRNLTREECELFISLNITDETLKNKYQEIYTISYKLIKDYFNLFKSENYNNNNNYKSIMENYANELDIIKSVFYKLIILRKKLFYINNCANTSKSCNKSLNISFNISDINERNLYFKTLNQKQLLILYKLPSLFKEVEEKEKSAFLCLNNSINEKNELNFSNYMLNN